MSKNIDSEREGLVWNCSDLSQSLEALRSYVENEATKAIEWYWRNKRGKALLSRGIQWMAVVLTAAAGLVPVFGQLLFGSDRIPSGLWSTALVGLAAALIGLDRAFGYSSGWARYVLAATEIRKRLDEFRMDWTALSAVACPNPATEQVGALIQRAKEFRLTVEDIVGKETRDWVTEFQNNFSQLEKDVKSQLDALRLEAETQKVAMQPGALELTVSDADKTEGFVYEIVLTNTEGTAVSQEKVATSKTWVRMNLPPGQYGVKVTAKVPDAGGAAPASISKAMVVMIKPGEVTKQTTSVS